MDPKGNDKNKFPPKTSLLLNQPPSLISGTPLLMPVSIPDGAEGMQRSQTQQSFSSHESGYTTAHSSVPIAMTPSDNGIVCPDHEIHPTSYEPVKPWWFFRELVEPREIWHGFCSSDTDAIERAYQASLTNPSAENVVFTDGRRYDVYVRERERRPVYWEGETNLIRRCTWFYKHEGLNYYVPYDELTAHYIEEGYKNCVESDRWLQRCMLLDGAGMIYFEDAETIYHYSADFDSFSQSSDTQSTPRILVRGVPNDAAVFILEDIIPRIDHVIMVVQGIGSVCDMRFRTVDQCVDSLRYLADTLTLSHFKDYVDSNKIGRVEFLPISWHSSLHTDNIGFDRRMRSITLQSIPKLRHFTNDTLLDILLYSSPMYCQKIINTVAGRLNSQYDLFMKRNPDFKGGVSVAGHSLGSLILFDILANTKVPAKEVLKTEDSKDEIRTLLNQIMEVSSSSDEYKGETVESAFNALGLEEFLDLIVAGGIKRNEDIANLYWLQESDLKKMNFPKEHQQKFLDYVKNVSHQYELRNLPSSSNLNDVSDYLLYPSSFCPLNPAKTIICFAAVPSLKFNCECFFALGSPISMFLAVRGFSTINKDYHFPTCSSFFNIFHPFDPVAYRIELLIDPSFPAPPVVIPHHKGRKRMHIEIRENLAKMGTELKQKVLNTMKYTWDHFTVLSPRALPTNTSTDVPEQCDMTQDIPNIDDENIKIGALNKGRRIDYVLQEKPIEALNEYIFALSSHGTYWDSEDTVLMILKELHALRGVYLSANHDISMKHKFDTSKSPFSTAASTLHSHVIDTSYIAPTNTSHNIQETARSLESFSICRGPFKSMRHSHTFPKLNLESAASGVSDQFSMPVPKMYDFPFQPQQSQVSEGAFIDSGEPKIVTTENVFYTPLAINSQEQQESVFPPFMQHDDIKGPFLPNMEPSVVFGQINRTTSEPSVCTSQNLGTLPTSAPPLTGFVKKSPFK